MPGHALKELYKQIVKMSISCALLLFVYPVQGAEEDDDAPDYRGMDCIWVRSIRDYAPLDKSTLLIWAGGKRAYYVRLTQPSADMRTAHGLQVYSRDDRLCPFEGDGLIFRGFDERAITVRSIKRISEDQADELLVRYGKKPGSEPQTPVPKEVQGAEVEELD